MSQDTDKDFSEPDDDCWECKIVLNKLHPNINKDRETFSLFTSDFTLTGNQNRKFLNNLI